MTEELGAAARQEKRGCLISPEGDWKHHEGDYVNVVDAEVIRGVRQSQLDNFHRKWPFHFRRKGEAVREAV